MSIDTIIKDNEVEIITRRDGVGVYGLYTGFIIATEQGEFLSERRYFLTGEILSTYMRISGEKRAGWKPFVYTSHEEAKKNLSLQIETHTKMEHYLYILRYPPILVELVMSDIEQIAHGQTPHARSLAPATITRLVGKVDEDSLIQFDEYLTPAIPESESESESESLSW